MSKSVKTFIIFILLIVTLVIVFKVKIRHVEVEGNTKYTEEGFVSKIFEKESDRISILLFVSDKLGKHKDITFVDSYEIEWITPFAIKIHVKEKEPIGFIKKDIINVYFDDTGVIGEMSNNRKEGLPEIRGLNFKAYTKGEKLGAENQEYLKAILKITGAVKEFSIPCDLIEFNKNHEITVYINNLIIQLGTIDNLDIKLNRLNDIYKEIKDLSGTLDLKDARENMVDEQYIFKKSS